MQAQFTRPAASASAKTPSVNSRPATLSSDHQRRREAVCRVLSQIYVRAERVRTAKVRQSQLRRGETRRPNDTNSGEEERDEHASLSLIELIQASYAIFKRYGITAPDDAVYHRYLLSLSVDPERDWRKKIRSFDLSRQPRVRRLCSGGSHLQTSQSRRQPSTSRLSGSTKASAPVGRSSRRSSASYGGSSRRPSLVSEPRTPLGWSLPPSSTPSDSSRQCDRFGDMLSLDVSPSALSIQSFASSVPQSESTGCPAESVATTAPKQGEPNLRRSLYRVAPMPAFSSTEYAMERELNSSAGAGDSQLDSGVCGNNASTMKAPASESFADAEGSVSKDGERQLQMLATTFEQWRAMQAVKRLVKQNKLRDQQLTQQFLPPQGVYAVFRWIARCLPEKRTFQTAENCQSLPLFVLRRVSVQSGVSLETLQCAALGAQRWQAKILLATWYADARNLRGFRVRMIVKRRAAVLETAFRCIQCWRLFTEGRKCSTDRANWVAQRCSRGRLRHCLEHWRQRFQEREQHHQAVKSHDSRLARRYLERWRHTVVTSRSARLRYKMAAKKFAVARWKRKLMGQQASRALCRLARRQCRLRLLRESWRRLRVYAAYKQTLRASMEQCDRSSRVRRQREVLELWRAVTEDNSDLRIREERFRHHTRRRRLRQTLAAWSAWAERRCALTVTLLEAMEARAGKQLHQAFGSWKEHFAAASETEERLLETIWRLKKQRIWMHWRKHVGVTSAARRLDDAHCVHVLLDAFSKWREHADRQTRRRSAFLECQYRHVLRSLRVSWKALATNLHSQQLKHVAAEAASDRKRLESKRGCFHSWQALVKNARERHECGDQVREAIRRPHLLRIAWASWRRVFWQQSVAHLADKHLNSYRTANTFRAWKKLRVVVKQRRARAVEVVEAMGSFRLSMRFRQWRVLVARKGRLEGQFERVFQTRCRRALQTHWDVWRQALEKQRDRHGKLSEVVSRWQSRQLRGSFDSWKTRWSLRKRHRRLLQTVLATSREKFLETNFTAWKAFRRACAAREQRIRAAQVTILQSRAKRAIGRWNERRVKQHKRNRLLKESLVLWRQARVEAVFGSLVAYTQWRKQRKTHSYRARVHFHRNLVQRTFTVWLSWRQRKATIDRTFQTAVSRVNTRKMARGLLQLRFNAQQCRRLKTAVTCAIAMRTDRAKIDGFARWTAFVDQRAHERQEQVARQTAMQCFRMQRSLQQWRHHLQMRKLTRQTLLQATTASRSSQLQQHFAIWRKFTQRNTFAKALKQKAIAFRYFCLLPLYFEAWRMFLKAKKHKRELLLRARGLWCHQSERRAFASWTQYTVTSQQTKRAVAKWQSQAIVKCFASWRCFEVQQKQQQLDQARAEVFHDRRKSQQALKRWHLTARSIRLTRRCTDLWRQNTSRVLFDTWSHHVKLIQSGRWLLLRIKNQMLARIFTSWKAILQHKAERIQGIQERFTLLWRADRRESYWTRWKRFTRLRVVLKRALWTQQTQTLGGVIRSWHTTVTKRQMARRAALQVSTRRNLQLQRVYWVDWRAQRRLRQCVAALRGKVIDNRVTGELRQRFSRWGQVTVRALAVKRFVRCQDLALLRLVFTEGFRGFVALQHKNRGLSKQLGRLHDAFLCEWLSSSILQRMTTIQACEDMRQSKSCKRLVMTAWQAWVVMHTKKQIQQAAIRHLRWQVAQVGAWRDHQSHDVFTGILRRWKNIQTVRIFENWRLQALALGHARRHAIAAIDWWHKTQCRRYFDFWTNFCRRRRLQKRIRAMGTHCKLKRVWERWKVFERTEKHRRELNQRASQFHSTRVCTRAVVTWREAATAHREQRELVLELYEASRVKLLAALMNEWREFAAVKRTRRTQTAVARVVHQDKLRRRSFQEWKAHVASICCHRQLLQANTERLQVLLLCSYFRAWLTWSQQQHKLHAILQSLTSKCDSRTASKVLTAWHLHAAKTAGLRHRATAFLHFRRLHRGVTALRVVVQDERRHTLFAEKARLFRSVLASQSLESVFQRWRTFSMLSRKTRIVTLQYLQDKLLPSAWSAWVAHVRRRRLRSDRMAAAATCWANVLLRRAWNSVKLFHQLQSARREAFELAEQHYTKFRLQRTVRQWRVSSQETQHLTLVCRHLLVRWRMQTVYRCFCAWHERAAHSKAVHNSAAVVKLKLQASTALRTWYAWRKLFLVLRSGNRRLLQRYWTAWCKSRASRLVLLGFQQQIQTQMLRSTQRRRLQLWKQFVANRKMEKAMTLLSAAFAGSRLLRRNWDVWRDFVARRHGIKTRVHQALAFRSRSLQAQTLHEWRKAVVEAISRRQKLAYYVNALQYTVQRRSFTSWRVYVAHRGELRLKMAQALALRSQLCSHTVFQTWRTFVDNVRKKKSASRFYKIKTTARTWRCWQQGVLLGKVERMLGASAQRQLETSFLSWRKAVAKTQQLRAFRAKAARRQWTEQVAAVFQAWSHLSRLHTRCRALLSSAAAGNHLRFRFTLWQSFTTQQKRLALLLHAPEPSVLTDGSLEPHSEERSELVAVAQALARKARVLQRLEVTWNLPETWRRWRLAFHAQLFYRLRRLQARFVAWQQFVHRQRRSRWIVLKLTRQRQAADAQSIFRAWAELVARVKQLQQDRRRERELWGIVNTELVRRQRRSLRNHWHAWQRHVEQTRHLQTSLEAYYRARLVTTFWLAWRHDFRRVVAEERRKRTLVDAGMCTFRLRRVLRRLRENQQRRKRLRLVLEYIGNRSVDKLLPAVLSHWRRWTQRQKQLVQCQTVAQARKLAQYVAVWKTWNSARRRQRQVVNCLLNKHAVASRRTVWLAWRRYVDQRVAQLWALQSAAVFHTRKRLQGRWLRHSQLSRELRDRSEAAHCQLEELRVRRGVARWRGFSRDRLLRRRCKRFTLRKHIRQWRAAVKLALATRFHEFVLRCQATKMLAAWSDVAKRRRCCRRLYEDLLMRQEERSARRALLQLQRYTWRRRCKRMASEHASKCVERGVFHHWRRMTQKRQQGREQRLERAAEHEARALLRQHVAKWRRAAEKQRERRFVLLSCVVKLRALSDQRLLEVTHCAWRQLVQRARRSRVASIKRDCSVATRAIATWSAWMRARQRLREQMDGAAAYHAQRLQSAAFFYWQTYALAWQDAAKPMARRQARQSLVIRTVVAHGNEGASDSDSGSDSDVRRPLSPVVKRLQQQNAKRQRREAGETQSETLTLTPTLPEAAELSMDVKKRLLLLGKWKPPQKSLLPPP